MADIRVSITVEDAFLKIKEVINSLEADKIPRLVAMLGDELASNIQGSSNKTRVLLHKQTRREDEDCERNVASIGLAEPLRKSPSSCENNKLAHTAETAEEVKEDEIPNISDDDYQGKLGFIFVDGFDTLFGTLKRDTDVPEIIYKLSVIPPEYRLHRGGMAIIRRVTLVSRKREEFKKKTLEVASKLFINPATGEVNVSGGLIVGGSKIGYKLLRDMCFDPRLVAKIVCKVEPALREGEEGLEDLMTCWCCEREYRLQKDVANVKSSDNYA